MDLLVRVFLSILKSSLTASVLILVVIGILYVFNKNISVRVKNTIWILVLIKILIPVNDHVNTNLFCIIYEKYGTVIQYQNDVKYKQFQTGEDYTGSAAENNDFLLNIVKSASFIWFTGVFLLSFWLLIAQLNLIRKTKNSECNIDMEFLIKKCNIKTKFPVYICDDIKSPCISGIIKPKIYIPSYVLNISDNNQLSYIFLHELVHYKRKDLIYNFFSILALFLHWFNPFVWLAVKKMNLYRECACDACVLELLKEEESIEYGLTLLNLSKLYLETGNHLQLPVFFKTNNQISERIWLIKGFKKGSYKIKANAVLGCTIAAFLMLTNNIPVHALNAENILKKDRITGWIMNNGGWYYYDNGVMLKNTNVNGYELGTNGALVKLHNNNTSEDTIPTHGWYLNKKDGKWYYIINNSYVKGWLKTSVSQGTWFYFDEHGAMVNNTTLNIDGKDYIFAANGMCTNIEY